MALILPIRRWVQLRKDFCKALANYRRNIMKEKEEKTLIRKSQLEEKTRAINTFPDLVDKIHMGQEIR